jgi:hypothetical protein
MSAIGGKADIELTCDQCPLFSPVAVQHPRRNSCRFTEFFTGPTGPCLQARETIYVAILADLRTVRRAQQKSMTNHADAYDHAILVVPTR